MQTRLSMTTEERPQGRFRVVLDTNVYISIFTNPQGQLGAMWDHGRSGTYTLLISPAIVAELANVLREKFHWPEEAIIARAKRFARMAEIITPTRVPNVIAHNPADNHILACAVSGSADLILTFRTPLGADPHIFSGEFVHSGTPPC
jgi:uncharacterized protein